MNRCAVALSCFAFFFFSSIGAAKEPYVSPNADQKWKQMLDEIKQIHKPLQKGSGLQDKILDPAMNEEIPFQTMDGSQQFKSPLICSATSPIIEVTHSPASYGEVNILLKWGINVAQGLNRSLSIKNVGGVCNGVAIHDCLPGWKGCKFGALEQGKNGEWYISDNLPSGEPRIAEGLEGCFCFSAHCGSRAEVYKEQIQQYVALPLANALVKENPNLVISGPLYDAVANKTIWSAGDTENCSLGDVSSLTSQTGKLELDYAGAVSTAQADEESPWSLLTSNLEKKTTDMVCYQEARVTSEWKSTKRSMPTKVVFAHDSNGSSTQCFYATKNGGCGYYFGEPDSWNECINMARQNVVGVCNRLWVSSNHFTSIADVQNVREDGPISSVSALNAECYGANSNDKAQPWAFDCIGWRDEDYFVCMSPGKGEKGDIIFNSPYDIRKYDGCEEIRPYFDGCESLSKSESCKLVEEITDGVFTIKAGNKTGGTVSPSCRVIQGVKSSITVCEPWWKRKRIYSCSDGENFTQIKERTNYINQNVSLSDSNHLSTIGDLTFDNKGNKSSSVIDAQIQFQAASKQCIPSCIVEARIPNYELVVPQDQGKLESDGSWHVEDLEASNVPNKMRTVVNTLDCDLENNQYTCPVPEGWTVRSQCSCGDGREFVNAITSLLVINQMSKDFICSTGKEQGVCETPEEQTSRHVLCGNFHKDPTGTVIGIENAEDYKGELVLGRDIWECSPKMWKGKTAPDQTHLVYLGEDYSCMGGSSALTNGDPYIKTGPIYPQKSWFAPVIDWARSVLVSKLTGKDSIWATSGDECLCGSLNNDEIPICQFVTASGQYSCLSTSANYGTLEGCRNSCPGKATRANGKICIWKNDMQASSLPYAFDLGLQPKNEAVFGEVRINALFSGSVEIIDDFPECKDISYTENAIPIQEPVNCLVSSEAKTVYTGWRAMAIVREGDWYCRTSTVNGYGAGCGGKIGRFSAKKSASSSARSCLNNISLNYSQNDCNEMVNNGSLSRLLSVTFDIQDQSVADQCKVNRFFKSEIVYRHRGICNGQKDYYVCPINGSKHENNNTCNSGCTKTVYKCTDTGRIVNHPEECYRPQYKCSANNNIFDTNNACVSACRFTGPTNQKTCKNTTLDKSYSAFITPSSSQNGFDMKLVEITPETQARVHLGQTHYPAPEVFLQQCFRQYSEPYIKFDEPGTNAHFEYSFLDTQVYLLAAQQGVFPITVKQELPALPAVYQGSAQRQYKLEKDKLWEESTDENGNIIVEANPDISTEERNKILSKEPRIKLDENGNYVVEGGSSGLLVPRRPMFWEKKYPNSTYDPALNGRAGQLSFTVSHLASVVYYHECPYGVTNATKECGQIAPYGGVASTIAGDKCFQYFCDENSIMETNSAQQSGCGLTNDGIVVPTKKNN